MARPLALGLDLGSTSVKAARLDADGCLRDVAAVPSPELTGEGPIRETDAEAYLRAAERVLERAGRDSLPLGIASQRSSFLLWDRTSGEPATPLVSWQDRRAAPWCFEHAELAETIRARTGLLLSPHYVGPKFASMTAASPALRKRVDRGEVLLGTLDAWLVWKWTGGCVHRTDPTMAARTLLFDLERGDWSDELLGAFGVPREILPAVEPTAGRETPLSKGRLAASVADQASGLAAAAGSEEDVALVSAGTGCFVLRPTGERVLRRPGYHAGPALALAGRPVRFALEGTINGGGAVADRFGTGPTELPDADPAPDAFCLPDSAGIGAPHWRADGAFATNAAAQALPGPAQRRVVLEGLIFRMREILEGVFEGTEPKQVLLVGGLARDPFVGAGLAACLGRPVHVLDQPEGTLLGAALLAAGVVADAADGRRVEPARSAAWLSSKYARWREWIEEIVAGAPTSAKLAHLPSRVTAHGNPGSG
jgi:glycerol kinase